MKLEKTGDPLIHTMFSNGDRHKLIGELVMNFKYNQDISSWSCEAFEVVYRLSFENGLMFTQHLMRVE